MAYPNNRGGGQPQSQYLQTFDASHLSQPPPNRHPVYTVEQKDTAIRLLNEGTRARTIAQGIGGTCSKSNPYRWRAEVLERKRRGAEERVRARQEWIRRRRVDLWNFILAVAPLLLIIFMGVVEGIAVSALIQSSNGPHTLVVCAWILWRLIIFIALLRWIIDEEEYIQLHLASLVILCLYIIYQIKTSGILPPKLRKPRYEF